MTIDFNPAAVSKEEFDRFAKIDDAFVDLMITSDIFSDCDFEYPEDHCLCDDCQSLRDAEENSLPDYADDMDDFYDEYFSAQKKIEEFSTPGFYESNNLLAAKLFEAFTKKE